MLLYPSLTSNLVKIFALLRVCKQICDQWEGILVADRDVVNMPVVLYWSQFAVLLL
jgi:hypothetical protein